SLRPALIKQCLADLVAKKLPFAIDKFLSGERIELSRFYRVHHLYRLTLSRYEIEPPPRASQPLGLQYPGRQNIAAAKIVKKPAVKSLLTQCSLYLGDTLLLRSEVDAGDRYR